MLDSLRKMVIEGCIILLHLFYHQPVYVGDSCVEYKCVELKHNDDVGKMFCLFSKFSSKGLIKLNATFSRSLDEILVLLHKPRKPRFAYLIIALMCDKSV